MPPEMEPFQKLSEREPRRRSPISDVIESLEKQQAILGEKIGVLGDRIGAVLGGEIDSQTAPASLDDATTNSYLYYKLASLQDGNEALAQRLTRLIDRVEL